MRASAGASTETAAAAAAAVTVAAVAVAAFAVRVVVGAEAGAGAGAGVLRTPPRANVGSMPLVPSRGIVTMLQQCQCVEQHTLGMSQNRYMTRQKLVLTRCMHIQCKTT